jgi:CYTH domain-containing protein
MAQEIERKFRIVGEAWRSAEPARYRQGYLCRAPGRTVRVRTIEYQDDSRAFLTLKGASTGASRMEFEYEIPLADAHYMLDNFCIGPLIEKDRREVPYAGFVWEVDEFFGENAGLIFAEVELTHEGQEVPLPPWIGEEVTHLARYFNANLTTYPYSQWRDDEKA